MAEKKTATKKKAAVPKEKKGAQGRVSAAAGKKIKRLMKTEETGLRATGKVRECWDLIKDGMTVETYRATAADSGHANAVLRTFVAKGYVELV